MSAVSLINFVTTQTQLKHQSVKACLHLLEDGATIPFIARYRKERTNHLNEVEIEQIVEARKDYQQIEKRRTTITESIQKQGQLSDTLKEKLEQCNTIQQLEDLYLPYKTSRKTKASIALELGFKPLAVAIMKEYDQSPESLTYRYKNYTSEEALEHAQSIVIEWISQNEWVKNRLRNLFVHKAKIKSKLIDEHKKDSLKFKDYFDFEEPLKHCKSHRFMALRRASNEGILRVNIAPNRTDAIQIMQSALIKKDNDCSKLIEQCITKAYSNHLKPSIERELFNQWSNQSDAAAIKIFRRNLEEILMTSPLGEKRILAIDPGYKSGCKLVCLDQYGQLLHNETIYPHAPTHDKKAINKISTLTRSYKIQAIAIGNGTASRETEALVKRIRFDNAVEVFVVSEAGASVYSASTIARKEFPQYDVTVRGAVSIGRRLMDPLAELVKIEPKALGVGQYQHDIHEGNLEDGLSRTIESCVNQVGVNVNTASLKLLSYVSGIGEKTASNLIEYRSNVGPFKSREEFKQVSGIGEKTFEQCAGFLRISDANNPLDNSAVHPEHYTLVQKMAKSLSVSVKQLVGNREEVAKIDINQYATEIGTITLKDILDELIKPNRDPRKKAKVFDFKKGLKSIDDLTVDEIVPGIVTNVAGFGAFVDIGLKENGLIHVSEMADRFISDPNEIVTIQQTLLVKIKSIDFERKRIALTLKGVEQQ